MNKNCEEGLAIFLNFAFLTNQLFADLPVVNFEATSVEWAPSTVIGQGAQAGWQLHSGNAVVSGPGEGFGGGQALKIPVDVSQETRISRDISWDINEKTAFIDFQVKPPGNSEGSLATLVANGTQVAFQLPEGATQGEIWVLHGEVGSPSTGGQPQQWIKTAGTFTVPAGGSGSSNFVRITMRQDYFRNLWDLFIDGKLVGANLAFEQRDTNLQRIDFYGSHDGATFIDDLSALTTNMLFPDADKDGLADAWEIANGSNPNVYDRDAIKPGTSGSYLDDYMASLWASNEGVNGYNPIPASTGIPPLTIQNEAPHEAVGSLKGSLSVGGDGSASYSIPIDIPKGTGGMEPKLGLGYSSNSGNGIVGVGWNVAGLQRITRGPSSAAKDGSYDPMDFDAEDRFFLDGERLVCVQGTYGAANSEYRTEMDSYARITAVGAGPSSWKIETKAGLIVTLGGTDDSKTSVALGTLSWGVTEVKDTVGNYYSVDYVRDDFTPDSNFVNHRVSAINYTGNASEGRDPYCTVDFLYENRSDINRSNNTYAGYLSSKRLSKIKVSTGSYVNHAYRLVYENSYQTGRSFLKSVTKYMRDINTLKVPATLFSYAGLQEPANSSDNPVWKNPGATNLPLYGTNLDATSQVNSTVTVDEDTATIRLIGDVSRAYVIPDNGVQLASDSKLQFEFHSNKLGKGAMIGLDTDKSYQVADEVNFYQIGGTGPISMGGVNFNGTRKDYLTTDGWRAYNLPIGSIGLMKYLVLMCVDDDISDGVDSAYFRNVKIYTQSLNTTVNINFDVDRELPRYASSTGKDLGVVSLDINGDGLPDLSDWRVVDYSAAGGFLTPSTEGNIFINNGDGFTRDNALRPTSEMPLGVRPTDTTAYTYNDKHSLLAQPMDIDGDGYLDLMESANIKTSTGYIQNGYIFRTLINGVWTAKAGWNLPFVSANDASDSYGGKRRFEYFQWADLNSDGYQDLILRTTPNGELYTPGQVNAAGKIIGGNTSIAYINKGKNVGWTRNYNRYLPETLLQEQKDIGRRMVDLNGDGVMEITEALGISTNKVRHTYFMNGTSGYQWNSAPGLQNPPTSRYDIPPSVSFVDTSFMNRGAFLADLNGDGLVDLVESNLGTPSKVWTNRAEKGTDAWRAEALPQPFTTASVSNYNIPFPLQVEKDGAKVPYGYELADINGDGLVDLIYSSTEDAGNPGTANTTLLNTGNGWQQRDNWALPGNQRIYDTTSDRNAGNRRSRLQDIDGDGFPDLITGLIGQTPKVWINQCQPEVLTGIVDGMGTDLSVAYKRLNDPGIIGAFGTPVYDRTISPFVTPLAPGQASIIDSRLVVSSYSEPNGTNGRRYRYQRYGDLRYDRTNESSLGFGWIEAMDGLNSQITRTETSRVFPFGGSPIYTKTTVLVTSADLNADLNGALVGVNIGSKVLSEEFATYEELPTTTGVGGIIRRPVQTWSVKSLKDLKGTEVSNTTTHQDFDNFGFVTASIVSSLDASAVSTSNTYSHIITGGWQLGRLSQSTVTKSMPGKASITKKSAFSYDSDGLLETETIEPGTAFASTKTYEHDGFGNVTKTTVTAAGVNRYSFADYDADGRFLESETNQLNQSVHYNYDSDEALLQSTSDITGKVTSFGYDDYGTLTRTYHPDGTETAESTGNYGGNLPSWVTGQLNAEISYFRAKQTSGSPVAIVYLDHQGKELVAQTTILKNANLTGAGRYAKIYTVTRYDSLGRKFKISEPFSENPGEDLRWTKITRDVVGRILETTRPDGQTDQVMNFNTITSQGAAKPLSYSKVKNASGAELERWEDQHGRLVQSSDPSGQITTFEHDLEGRILKVTVGGVLLLQNTFDLLGNKTDVWEANSGTSHSAYNALGEVRNSTNANGQLTSFTTDSYGRPETVTKPEGTYTTSYFTTGPALGQPKKTVGPSGYLDEITSVDAYGRTLSSKRTIAGETFTTSTTYDFLGRVHTETDAGGLTILHEYDPLYSFPVKLSIGIGSPGAGKILWAAGEFDSKGRAISQTIAQNVVTSATYKPNTDHLQTLKASVGGVSLQDKGYGWDTMGNLSDRTDLLMKRSESFGYDSLNRLTGSTATSLAGAPTTTVPPPASFGYNTKGNLLSKPGAILTYGGTRPHAVSSATIKGASRDYTYDAAGYITSDGKRTYTWASFGQLATLDYATAPALQDFYGTQIYAASQVTTNFTFDAGGNRVTQSKTRTSLDGSAKSEQTFYLGAYEREIHQSRAAASGSSFIVDRTVHRHSIGGFAVYTTTDKPGLPSETRLTTLLKDHLGSTDVLYTGTWNGSTFASPVTERQSFDSWGERRDPATLVSYRASDTAAFRTSGQDYDRGYTGHEQLDDSGLIHMNGRIYDPELGRMLSPDPYVQVPEYSQNFNRYSYVMNNPLNLTDPTGFSWLGDILHDVGGWLKENWRTVVVLIVVAIVTWGVGTAFVVGGNAALAASGGAYSMSGAITSFTAMSAGGGAILSAGGMAATGAIAGAVGGGLGAALNGGDLGDVLRGAAIGAVQGAIAGGVLHGMEPASGSISPQMAAHVAGHGVLGGAANAAMGGKFQDGFISAAASAGAGDMGWLSGATPTERTIKAGIVGGTASALGGGKFANGAYTAAFQHLLNYEAQSIRDARRRILETAMKYKDSMDWAYSAQKGNFPTKTWKCNQFVYDVISEAGVDAPGTYDSKAKVEWPAQAGTWANTKIKIQGWRVLGPTEIPQGGDVVSYSKLSTDATGHVGIVVSRTFKIFWNDVGFFGGITPRVDVTMGTSIGAHEFSVSVNNHGFDGKNTYVFRRYIGK
jgi:RHS repeat-associated protein